jgi:hypothetical protein
MADDKRRSKTCPCAACDASGRVPTSPGDLGRGCFAAAMAAMDRKRSNGGQWTAEDLEYDARVRDPAQRAGLLRRLTLKVCEETEYLRVADQIGADAERRRTVRPPRAPR